MVIPFSFTFKSPALHEYASASSLSKSSKIFKFCSFWWYGTSCIQFSKFCQSHICYIFLKFQVCTTNVQINYDFILSKSLNSPNLYTLIKIKNWICACSIVSRVFIYASNKPLCGTLIISLGKNSICAYYLKQIKTSFARIK